MRRPVPLLGVGRRGCLGGRGHAMRCDALRCAAMRCGAVMLMLCRCATRRGATRSHVELQGPGRALGEAPRAQRFALRAPRARKREERRVSRRTEDSRTVEGQSLGCTAARAGSRSGRWPTSIIATSAVIPLADGHEVPGADWLDEAIGCHRFGALWLDKGRTWYSSRQAVMRRTA